MASVNEHAQKHVFVFRLIVVLCRAEMQTVPVLLKEGEGGAFKCDV